MKLLSLVMGLPIAMLAVLACTKETSDRNEFGTQINRQSLTPDMPNPSGGALGVFVTLNQDGHYKGNGIDFGPTFTFPLKVSKEEQGEPWGPTVSMMELGGTPTINYTQDGSRFAIEYAKVQRWTYIGASQMHEYLTALNAWDTAGRGGEMPQLSSYTTFLGDGSTTGVITGKFVKDRNSPTHVSIVPVTFLSPMYISD